MSMTRNMAAAAAFLAAAAIALPAVAENLGSIHIFPTPAWREKTGRRTGIRSELLSWPGQKKGPA